MKLPSSRNVVLIAFLMALTFKVQAQIKFEKGYFIDNTSKRIECIIKNVDWKKNPTEIYYRLSDSEDEKTKTIDYIKEFGIYGVAKYLRVDVEMDRSSKRLNKLSSASNPIFEKETILLKVLVEGAVSLYQYQDFNLTRYFYNPKGFVEQLVHKKYKVDGQLSENNAFRQQLWNYLRCDETNLSEIKAVDYNAQDLSAFFIRYNDCNNIISKTFDAKEKRDLFNLTIRPRINSSSLSIRNFNSVSRNIDFSNQTNFAVGLEAEYIFPFNKNKWSIFLEGSYQDYEDSGDADSTGFVAGPLRADVDYSAFEFALGLRHYFFFSDDSKIFIDLNFNLSLGNTTKLTYTTANDLVIEDFETQSNPNFGIGIGYKLKDRYLIGIRYLADKHILNFNREYDSDYRTISFVIGYSLF